MCEHGVPFTPDNIGSECPVNEVVNITKICRPGKGKKQTFLPQGIRDALVEAYGLTRLGEAGADAFTIMKLAGHPSIIISAAIGYIHQTSNWRDDGAAFDSWKHSIIVR
jgi:hypothetical protein